MTRRRGGRGGSTVLQTVVVMQVLLLVFFGSIEFGQYLYVKMAFQAAARDAARAASLATATEASVQAVATTTLAQANVTFNSGWFQAYDVSSDGSTVTAVSDLSTIPSGDRVKIVISTTYDQVPNAFRPLYQMFGKGIGPGKPMVGNSTVVRE
jgi:Flp pilus assembly protein TadG